MKVICLTSFVHGALHLHAGAEAEFSSGTAAELIGCGLVREAVAQEPEQTAQATPVAKKTLEPSNKAARVPKNKAVQETPEADAPPAETPAPAAEAMAPAADAPEPAPEAPTA